MYNKFTEKGFTLIELLVVIAIIGILAGVLFVAINPKEQSDKARAAKMANDLKQIQEAFELTALDTNSNPYPTEDKLGLGGNPTLEEMVVAGKLKYLPEKIETNLGNAEYKYDNDGNVDTDDCGNPYNFNRGANIKVKDSGNNTIVQTTLLLDEIFDKSDGGYCGKIKWMNQDTFYYNLSKNN